MSYIINNSRGNIIAVIPDGTVNQGATSLSLVGQGVTNYGTDQNENLVFLLENFAKPPTPDQLATQLGTNEKRLNEVFYAEYGMPVFAWLREQRLHLSRQLLEQTDTAIADIAAHCGYSSPANFSTAFRERFGGSPRDFRKQLAERGPQLESE